MHVLCSNGQCICYLMKHCITKTNESLLHTLGVMYTYPRFPFVVIYLRVKVGCLDRHTKWHIVIRLTRARKRSRYKTTFCLKLPISKSIRETTQSEDTVAGIRHDRSSASFGISPGNQSQSLSVKLRYQSPIQARNSRWAVIGRR